MAVDPRQLDMFEDELRRAQAARAPQYFNPGGDVGLRGTPTAAAAPGYLAGVRDRANQIGTNAIATGKKVGGATNKTIGTLGRFSGPIAAGAEGFRTAADLPYLSGEEKQERINEGLVNAGGALVGGKVAGMAADVLIPNQLAPIKPALRGGAQMLGAWGGSKINNVLAPMMGKTPYSQIAKEREAAGTDDRRAAAAEQVVSNYRAQPYAPTNEAAQYVTDEINKLPGGFRNPEASKYLDVLENTPQGAQLKVNQDGTLQFTDARRAFLESAIEKPTEAAPQTAPTIPGAGGRSLGDRLFDLASDTRDIRGIDEQLQQARREYAPTLGGGDILEYLSRRRGARTRMDELSGLRKQAMSDRTSLINTMADFATGAERNQIARENNLLDYAASEATNQRLTDIANSNLSMKQQEAASKRLKEGYERNVKTMENLFTDPEGNVDKRSMQQFINHVEQASGKSFAELSGKELANVRDIYQTRSKAAQSGPSIFEKITSYFGDSRPETSNPLLLNNLVEGPRTLLGRGRAMQRDTGQLLNMGDLVGAGGGTYDPAMVNLLPPDLRKPYLR